VTDSEVKGIWFETARGWLSQKRGVAVVARVDARVSPQFRGILREPVVSEWYPEAALAEMLAALRDEITDGSPAEFVRIIEEITLAGVGRFFKLVLSLASPTFVLRKVPILWGRLRRGDASVEVDATADGARVRYGNFPWLGDENYRLMTVGTLIGVCKAAGAKSPRVDIVRWTNDSLVVAVHP